MLAHGFAKIGDNKKANFGRFVSGVADSGAASTTAGSAQTEVNMASRWRVRVLPAC
jgi:hypothetical protein